jgi:hypothetical protein
VPNIALSQKYSANTAIPQKKKQQQANKKQKQK